MKKSSILLGIGITFVLLVLLLTNTLSTWQSSLIDRMRLAERDTTEDIIIIGIDDESIEELGRFQDWNRTYFANVIDNISEGDPAAIVSDITFSSYSADVTHDENLLVSAAVAENVILPVKGVFSKTLDYQIEENTASKENTATDKLKARDLADVPFTEILDYVNIGHMNVFADKDNVVRMAIHSFQYEDKAIYSFDYEAYKMYTQYHGMKLNKVPPLNERNEFIINFAGDVNSYEVIPFYVAMNGDVPPEYYEGKIVLIGPYSEGMQDAYLTPYNHNDQMNGVEIHANVIQTYIDGEYKEFTSNYIAALILLLAALVAFLIFSKAKPIFSIIYLLGFCIGYYYIFKTAYYAGFYITLVYPILATILMFVLMTAYRYVSEAAEKRRIRGVFGKYVAPQVVNQILEEGTDGLALGGERKFISVLFVDIRGFTPLSEKCEPEEIVEILNSYLELCAKSIFDNGGTLDKFIGDATMAIFNAPLPLENHALHAVKTAWAMKQGANILEKELYERFNRTVQFGIGVNTGYAVVGNIGASFRMDYTAIGDTVNTSARLEANAKPGQILISEATYEQVKDKVEVTSLGGIKVKGKEKEIPIYQVEGIRE